MTPEDVRKLLITVSLLLVVFLAFFFLFWRPRYAELRRYQHELSNKNAELMQLERDAEDWPDSITRERLRRYEEQLAHLWDLIPSREEVSTLLEEIQTHAKNADLEIISMSRVSTPRGAKPPAGKEPRYVRVPYKISLSGNYFGLIKFLRSLEDSRRLVTITSTRIYLGKGKHPVDAEVQFNIFYSKVGVETG